MKKANVEAAQDIEKIARNLLKTSKAWGKFPTPVENIISCAELTVEQGVDLSRVEPGFFSSNFGFLNSAISKVLGLIDFRHNTIYIDQSQKEPRKNFVKLHEVGHKVLPWQKDVLGRVDDDVTIDPDFREETEREASFFASATLFQLERFQDEAAKLPLSINSPRALAQKFGSSSHSAIRRYVERSNKRCAVLVLNAPQQNGHFAAGIRDYFQSEPFTVEFGEISWLNGECGLEYPFVQDIQRKRRLHEDGELSVMTASSELVTFKYHFFNNGYNAFVLFFPVGEKIRSRTSIVER
jgi:hypothetical protein